MQNNSPDINKLTSFLNGDYSGKDAEYLREIFCNLRKEEDLKHVVKKYSGKNSRKKKILNIFCTKSIMN